jgi:hypothetical protein
MVLVFANFVYGVLWLTHRHGANNGKCRSSKLTVPTISHHVAFLKTRYVKDLRFGSDMASCPRITEINLSSIIGTIGPSCGICKGLFWHKMLQALQRQLL